MIRKHNAKQTVLGCVSLGVAVGATILTFWFFAFAIGFIGHAFGRRVDPQTERVGAGLVVLAVTATGLIRGLKGRGYDEFAGSAFDVRIPPVSGGAFAVQNYTQRVTVPAYVVTQLCLAGPLQLLAACRRFRSRIPYSRDYEELLASVLEAVRAEGHWVALDQLPDYQQEVRHLIQMKRLDFSPSTGKVRARA